MKICAAVSICSVRMSIITGPCYPLGKQCLAPICVKELSSVVCAQTYPSSDDIRTESTRASPFTETGSLPAFYSFVRTKHNKTTMVKTVSIFKSPFQTNTSCGIISHEVRNVVTISVPHKLDAGSVPTRAFVVSDPFRGPYSFTP